MVRAVRRGATSDRVADVGARDVRDGATEFGSVGHAPVFSTGHEHVGLDEVRLGEAQEGAAFRGVVEAGHGVATAASGEVEGLRPIGGGDDLPRHAAAPVPSWSGLVALWCWAALWCWVALDGCVAW